MFGVIDTERRRLLGNCNYGTMIDVDISNSASRETTKDIFWWSVPRFSSPLFAFTRRSDEQKSDLSSVAFISGFLNDNYAPIVQLMYFDRNQLRKQGWNVTQAPAVVPSFPVAASSYNTGSFWYSITSFITADSYTASGQTYLLLVQLDYKNSSFATFPELNVSPQRVPLTFANGMQIDKVRNTVGVYTLPSCPAA
jgi:hypothetical protein